MAKINTIFILIAYIFIFSGTSVLASSAMPSQELIVELPNVPEGAFYIDVLIKLSKSSASYSTYNINLINKYDLDTGCDLVTYNVDGYCSYSAHTQDANVLAVIPIDNISELPLTVKLWGGTSYENSMVLRRTYSSIKLAIFNKSGHLLTVSPDINVNPVRETFGGRVIFDFIKNTADYSHGLNLYVLILRIFILLVLPTIAAIIISILFSAIIRLRPIGFGIVAGTLGSLLFFIFVLAFIYITNTKSISIVTLFLSVAGIASLQVWLLARYYKPLQRTKIWAYVCLMQITTLTCGWLANIADTNIGGIVIW